MTHENLGNQLYRILQSADASLFEQGELAQLTYRAFDIAVRDLQANTQEEIELKFPIGYRPDRTPIEGTKKYRKEELINRYQFLAFHQLSINVLIKLVTILEAALGDIIRAIVIRYPEKLGSKRTVPLHVVLKATSMEEIHLQTTDALLTDKSPSEFAQAVEPLLSINFLECPPFHKYIEIKATRDIFIHNRGIANDIYARKAGSHARVKPGMSIPIDHQYLLESYESCLQVSEWLRTELHKCWHSSELEDFQNRQIEMPLSPLLPEPKVEEQNN